MDVGLRNIDLFPTSSKTPPRKDSEAGLVPHPIYFDSKLPMNKRVHGNPKRRHEVKCIPYVRTVSNIGCCRYPTSAEDKASRDKIIR